MSVVDFSFIDLYGKKCRKRVYAVDNEDDIDFLNIVIAYFLLLKSNGYQILRVEVT